MKYLVVWRQMGALKAQVVEGADPAAAYETFKGLKLGGGIPVNGTLTTEGGTTYVKNGEGKALVVLSAQG